MKALFLLPASLLAAHISLAQFLHPVPLTGFNADVVADGTGDAMTVTTHDFDSANFNLVAQGYTTPAGLSPTSFLPASGLINSAVPATPNVSYQLAPYSGNNSLRLSGTSSGGLSFDSPYLATKVYVLASSGSGISNATATVSFTDGSNEVFPLIVDDWYNGSNYAIQGVSRVKRTTNVLENSALNPRLYQHQLTISSANSGKFLAGISFTKLTPVGVLNVMAITLDAIALGTPEAVAAAELTACPNPSRGEFTVQLPAASSGPALLRVTDLTGRTASTRTIGLQAVETQVTLDLKDQPAGWYLLSLEGTDAVQHVRLLKE